MHSCFVLVWISRLYFTATLNNKNSHEIVIKHEKMGLNTTLEISQNETNLAKNKSADKCDGGKYTVGIKELKHCAQIILDIGFCTPELNLSKNKLSVND